MQIPILSDTISSWVDYLIQDTTASTTDSSSSSTMGNLARLTTLLAAAFPAAVVSDSPSSLPKVTSVTFSGSGCPQGRAPKFEGGFEDPTFIFNSDFAARLPSDRPMANCQVHIQASGASKGWQVALKDNWVSGNVVLSPGTSLEYYTSVYFSENAANTGTVHNQLSNTGSSTIQGEVVLHTDLAPKKVWSKCTGGDGYTGILNVNFRGILSGGEKGRGAFRATKQNWDFEWRRC